MPIDDQILLWYLSAEAGIRLWNGPLPKWVGNHRGHQKKPRLCACTIREAEWPSERQSPTAPNRPALFNSHIPKACNILRQKPLKRKGKTTLSFLAAYAAVLWASPPEDHGVLVTPFHLLLGNVPLSTLLNIHSPISSTQHKSAPLAPHPTAPMAPGPPVPSKWQHHFPSWTVSHFKWKPPQEWPLRSHPA